MSNTTRSTTAEDDIDAALAEGRLAAVQLAKAVRAEYHADEDTVVVELAHGIIVSSPRQRLQGLEGALAEQLSDIEIVGPGTGLHWPQLDVDHYLPGLLGGLFGNRHWMVELGRKGGRRAADYCSGYQNVIVEVWPLVPVKEA